MIADKLDFLMKITGATNSGLARDLGFSQSFISRLRSGSRGLPKSQPFLAPAAAYFARRLREPLQRDTVAEAVCPGRRWPEDEAEGERLLLSWLSRGEGETLNGVSRLLNDLAETPTRPHAHIPAEPKGDSAAPAAFFYGSAGKREAVLRFMTDLCASGEGGSLLLYSNEDAAWLREDPAFARRWPELLRRFVGRGGRIRIIYNLGRDPEEVLAALESWTPLCLTGAIEPFYDPRPREGAFRGTLYVAEGHSAVTSTAGPGSRESLSLLLTEPEAVAALAAEFRAYAALCKPMLQVFGAAESEKLWPVLRRFNAARSPWIIAQQLPAGFSLPENAEVSLLRRGGEKMAAIHREGKPSFVGHLEAGLPITELLCLPPVEEVRAGRVSIPLCDFMGMPELRYSAAEMKKHLAEVTALLRSRKNYRVVLTDRIPEGALLYAKEGVGCVVARVSPPTTALYITEPRLSAALWSYLSHFAELGQSRELVIRRLEEYMQEL